MMLSGVLRRAGVHSPVEGRVGAQGLFPERQEGLGSRCHLRQPSLKPHAARGKSVGLWVKGAYTGCAG